MQFVIRCGVANDSNLLDLSSCIFKQVSQLSMDGNDGSEYTRSCLLHALCSLHDQNKISDFNMICPNKPQRNQKYPKQIGEHARQKDAPVPLSCSIAVHAMLTAILCVQGDGDIKRIASLSKIEKG